MRSQGLRPKWWQVYLTLPLLIALFVLDSRLKISTRGHQFVQIGIVLLVYGLIHFWLKANASALSGMDREQRYGRIRVLRIPPAQLSESSGSHDAAFQLPASEVKGVLSDTFEMEYIDAVSFPLDKVSQESKKE
jgi:hypothetical protein